MKSDSRSPGTGGTARPFIGIHFVCCNVYRRVYLNREGTAYLGHCPRCARPVEVRAGEAEAAGKFWRAG